MNRRSYLTSIITAAGAVVLAGCSSDTDSGNGDGGVSATDVELVEHTLNRVEETPSSDSVSVAGEARNTADQEMSRIEIQVQFYTDAGDQADTATDIIRDLGPGETGLFEVLYAGAADRPAITDYDIEVTAAG